jgi:hypothetical protein
MTKKRRKSPTKKIEFTVPRGIRHGLFIYETEESPVPSLDAYGNATLGQIYRLLLEATMNIQARATADQVVERLLGQMMPMMPPEAQQPGQEVEAETVVDDIPEIAPEATAPETEVAGDES